MTSRLLSRQLWRAVQTCSSTAALGWQWQVWKTRPAGRSACLWGTSRRAWLLPLATQKAAAAGPKQPIASPGSNVCDQGPQGVERSLHRGRRKHGCDCRAVPTAPAIAAGMQPSHHLPRERNLTSLHHSSCLRMFSGILCSGTWPAVQSGRRAPVDSLAAAAPSVDTIGGQSKATNAAI